MGFVFSSNTKVRLPRGLKKAAEVRFEGLDGAGNTETRLHFSAPHFREVSPKLYEQQELQHLNILPNADWTVFNLLENILLDISDEKEESDRFDEPILRDLTGYKPLIQKYGLESICFDGPEKGSAVSVVDDPIIQKAESLRKRTPAPQRVRVCAKLDMLRVSDHVMELEVESGERFRAVWLKKPIEQPRILLGTQVLLEGLAVFKPSGNILRVEIDALEPASAKDQFFNKMPSPMLQESPAAYGRISATTARSAGLSLLGQWPGDESDEEIHKLLKEWS